MCLVISIVCFAVSYNFFESGNNAVAIVNLIIGIFFVLLMIKNILKTKKERKERKN